jgi:hypothetical protein
MWLPSFVVDRPRRAALQLKRPPATESVPVVVGRVGRFEYEAGFTHAHLEVLACLDRYFTDERIRRVRACVQQRRGNDADSVSLRTLDWVVTNYSKKVYLKCCSVDGALRDLHNAYREELDFYGRQLFDPFRRGPRVSFELDGVTQDTTIGQLNFFRFMIYSGVLDCALVNASAVEQDMIVTQARAKEIRANMGAKRRRVELTPSNQSRMHVFRLN